MAAPFYFGTGGPQAGINSLTVTWPANHAVNDVALLVIETDGLGTTLTPAGWTHVTGSPVTDVASAAGSKLHVLWRRATSTAEASVATGDSGDHQVAQIFVFRGVRTTGDPWNAITTGTKTTASTTATLPSITTTVDESLVVGVVSRPDDSASTTAFGAPVNAGITWDANADIEAGLANGNGGGFVMVAGTAVVAGSTGTTTLTCPSVTNAYVTIGLTRTSAQSMTGELGTFTAAGQPAALIAIRRTTGDLGTFALAGQDATLTFVDLTAYAVTADAGSFAEAGQDVNLLRFGRVTADPGAFAEQGQDAILARSVVMTGGVGAFAVAGQNATLQKNSPVIGGVGQFVLAGQPAGSLRTYALQAEVAALNEQGQPANLVRSRIMPADSGSLVLNGQPATTFRGRSVIADVGAFNEQGQDVSFGRIYSLLSDTGSLLLAGQDAGFGYTRQLPVETGELTTAGGAVNFRRQTFVPAWTATTSVVVGSLVRPTVSLGNGLVFRALNTGTTGSSQPTWPTTFGNTVVDGTVTWRAVSRITGDFQTLEPSAIIELFVLELNVTQHGVNDIYRFHAGSSMNANGNIVWAGNTYSRFPLEADGFEYSGQGQLPRPKMRVSNVFGTITALLLSLPSGLQGAKVTRIRTLARYLDAANFPSNSNPYGNPDSTAEFPQEIYYVDRKSIETRDVVEFELAAAFDLQGVRAPRRQCVSSICQWVYRSTECGYTAPAYYDSNNTAVASAALDVCGKRLDSCETRFDLYTKTGTVTVGSNVLTTASTLSILPGEPIRGWGLPSGTTVSAILSSTTIRVSNNSTASSTVTVTGTASGSGAFMTVTSSAGIQVGHLVTGPYMNGATVVGISGNTLTLSQRPYAVVKSGIYRDVFGDDWIDISSGTAGITVGMFCYGSFAVNKPVVTVEAGRVRIDTVTTFKQLYIDLATKLSVSGKTVVAYFVPQVPTAATYTFSANQTYSFRDPNAVLPFGSFPGVGGSYS